MVSTCTPQARGAHTRRALRRGALALAAFAFALAMMVALPVGRAQAIFGRSGLTFGWATAKGVTRCGTR